MTNARMPSRLFMAALATSALGSCFLTGEGTGPAAVGTEGGGGGVTAPCVHDDDCELAQTLCLQPSCSDEQQCTYLPLSAGSDCESGGFCDGQGFCLRAQAQPCDQTADCFEGECADGVCCESLCDEACFSCKVDDNVGTCIALPSGTDPDDECAGAPLCDGSGVCAEGTLAWFGSYGTMFTQSGRGIAIDPAGDTFLGVDFDGTIAFGADIYNNPGGQVDVAIAKLDAAGAPLWSRHWFGTGNQQLWGVRTTSDGSMVAAGYYFSDMQIDATQLIALSSADVWVASLYGDGTFRWAKSFGGTGFEVALDVDVDAINDDAVLLAGEHTGTLTFGSDVLTPIGGADAFVAKLDANGEPLWGRSWGDINLQSMRRARFTPEGGVIAAMVLTGTVDVGAGPMTSLGMRDIVIVKLDSTGQYEWARQFGGVAEDNLLALAVDPAGNVIFGGATTGSFSAGGSLLGTGANFDMFVVELDPNGDHLWSRSWGSAGIDSVETIAVDAIGNVVVAGLFEDPIDFGMGAITPIGLFPGYEGFAVKLSPDGTLLWVNHFGGDGDAYIDVLAIHPPSGRVAAAGDFTGDLFIGGTRFNSSPNSIDAMAMMLGP